MTTFFRSQQRFIASAFAAVVVVLGAQSAAADRAAPGQLALASTNGAAGDAPAAEAAAELATPVPTVATAASKAAQVDPSKATYIDQTAVPNGAQILDRLGAKIPLDVSVRNDAGESVTLKSLFEGRTKPVLLTLGYYTCPMLCSLVLNATGESLKGIDLVPGVDFDVISISIDPRDKTEVAAAKRKTHLEDLAKARKWDENGVDAKVVADGWRFYTVDAANTEDVRRLASAVGFGYVWDTDTDQFAHGAGIFFLSPEGVLSRTLFGLTFFSGDVKLALIEASEGKVGTIVDRIVLSCFQYTSDSQRYGLYIFGLFRLLGVLVIVFLGGFLLLLWRRERRERRRA